MVNHLNDEDVFEGKVIAKGELVTEGTLVISTGAAVGESVDTDSWPAQTRVQVADVTERAAVVAWRAANDPISTDNPLLVWRADGSLTGVNEITLDGVNWYAESPLAGDIEMTIAAAAPYGWLLCQGQVLASAATNYPALWAAADPAFRSGGSLRLPDLRGRMPMGAGQGTGLTLRNIGDVTGAETVVLTEAQLAAHDHSINHDHDNVTTDVQGNHSHQQVGRYTSVDDHDHGGSGTPGAAEASNPNSGWSTNMGNTNASGSHQHNVNLPAFIGSSDTAGNNEPHPNIPPSSIVNFKVKV